MFKKTTLIALAVSSMGLTMTACKSSSNGSDYVSHIIMDKNTLNFDFNIVFNPKVNIDLNGVYPVKNYGTVTISHNAGGQTVLDYHAGWELFKESDLIPVSTLPNGGSFPPMVTGPLYALEIANTPGQFKILIYVDNAPAGSPQRLVGVGIEIDSLKTNLPQISFSQSFFTSKNERFASFTLYGPHTENGKNLPGGLFLIADTNISTNQNTLLIAHKPFVYGPDSKNYKSNLSKFNILGKFRDALEIGGVYFNDENP